MLSQFYSSIGNTTPISRLTRPDSFGKFKPVSLPKCDRATTGASCVNAELRKSLSKPVGIIVLKRRDPLGTVLQVHCDWTSSRGPTAPASHGTLTQTESLLLAAQRPAGCVRVDPHTRSTHLPVEYLLSAKSPGDSPSRNKVKAERRTGEGRRSVRGRKEGREVGRKEGRKGRRK